MISSPSFDPSGGTVSTAPIFRTCSSATSVLGLPGSSPPILATLSPSHVAVRSIDSGSRPVTRGGCHRLAGGINQPDLERAAGVERHVTRERGRPLRDIDLSQAVVHRRVNVVVRHELVAVRSPRDGLGAEPGTIRSEFERGP